MIFPYMGTMHNNQTRVIIISITSSFNYFLANIQNTLFKTQQVNYSYIKVHLNREQTM